MENIDPKIRKLMDSLIPEETYKPETTKTAKTAKTVLLEAYMKYRGTLLEEHYTLLIMEMGMIEDAAKAIKEERWNAWKKS